MIRQASPRPNENVLKSIEKVLYSGQFVKGPEALKLENKFKEISGCEYNITCNSGTSALNLIFIAMDYPTGSEILVPANSFMASSNAVETSGYKTTFVDISLDSMNIDPSQIEKHISEKTKAILVVHLYGTPAPMDEIIKIAEKYNLDIFEDACQAHGSSYKGKKIGSIGKGSAFSLFPTKNLSVLGDGGIVSTNDKELAEKILMLRNAGRDKHPDDAEYFGFNFRLSEILAAVGNSLIKDFSNDTKRRQAIAQMYTEKLSGIGDLEIPKVLDDTEPVWHQYTIRTHKRDELKKFLTENQVGTSIKYSIPLHLITANRKKYGYREGDYPFSESAANSLLCLPMHPFLTDDDVDTVISKINEFFTNN